MNTQRWGPSTQISGAVCLIRGEPMRNVNITATPKPRRGIYCTRLRGKCSLCTLCNAFTIRKSSVGGCVSVIIHRFADFLTQNFLLRFVTWHVGFGARMQRPHSHKLRHSLLQVRTGGALRITSAFECPTPPFLFFFKASRNGSVWFSFSTELNMTCLVWQHSVLSTDFFSSY